MTRFLPLPYVPRLYVRILSQAAVNIAFYSIQRCWRRVAAALLALPLAACGDLPSGVATNAVTDADWSAARDVTIIMTEYRFTPAELSFEQGRTYRLHLENHGAELHEFTAPDFLAVVALRDPSLLAAGKHEVVVPPHTAKVIDFVARRPGRYPLICADHDWAGMVGTIIIE